MPRHHQRRGTTNAADGPYAIELGDGMVISSDRRPSFLRRWPIYLL